MLLEHLTDWSALTLGAAIAVAIILGDLAMAVSMQAVAPTRVDIGPGEKSFGADRPLEKATVISGFDASARGMVSIRGESWQAVRAADDEGAMPEGSVVRICERRGLTLVVSATIR